MKLTNFWIPSGCFQYLVTLWFNDLQNTLLLVTVLRSCNLRVVTSLTESLNWVCLFTYCLQLSLVLLSFPASSCFWWYGQYRINFSLAIIAARERVVLLHQFFTAVKKRDSFYRSDICKILPQLWERKFCKFWLVSPPFPPICQRLTIIIQNCH